MENGDRPVLSATALRVYFSTLCFLRWFAVHFFSAASYTQCCRAITLALARLSCSVFSSRQHIQTALAYMLSPVRPSERVLTGEQIYNLPKISQYATSYWWLIATMAVLLAVCEIFASIEVENLHFRPLYSDFRPRGGMSSDIKVTYTSLKNTFSGLKFCCKDSAGLTSFV